MHPLTTLNSCNLLNETGTGSFLTSCLTVYEQKFVLQQLKESIQNLQKQVFEKETKDSNNNFEGISGTLSFNNPHALYGLTIHFHEYRHFHDFVQSPFAFDFINTSANKWALVSCVMDAIKQSGYQIPQPLIDSHEKVHALLGAEAAVCLLSIQQTHEYFLQSRVQAKPNHGDIDEPISVLANPPLPPMPIIVTRELLIPLSLVHIMESSAILSQLSFILTSRGPAVTKDVWQEIEKTSIKHSQYQYVACLWALQNLFGEETLFDIDCLRAFRCFFRFTLAGFILNLKQFKSEHTPADVKHMPTFRFKFLHDHILESNLQKEFINYPEQVISTYAAVCYKDYPDLLDEHKKTVRQFIENADKIKPGHMNEMEFDIYCQLLQFYESAFNQDTKKIDTYLDHLWAEKHIPDLLEPPIKVLGLEDDRPPVLNITAENHEVKSLYFLLFIIDNLTNQFIFDDTLFCPLSGLSYECKKAEQLKKPISIYECNQDCTVRNVAHYMGFPIK